MENVKDVNVLKNRAECMNKVHSYCNKVVPELIEELNKGFRLLSNDYRFFKKDEERFSSILGKYPHFRAYIKASEYSLWLKVDDHYQVSECSCNYYGRDIYLYNMSESKCEEWKPLQMATEKELLEAKKRQTQIEYEISELKSELSTVNRLIEE